MHRFPCFLPLRLQKSQHTGLLTLLDCLPHLSRQTWTFCRWLGQQIAKRICQADLTLLALFAYLNVVKENGKAGMEHMAPGPTQTSTTLGCFHDSSSNRQTRRLHISVRDISLRQLAFGLKWRTVYMAENCSSRLLLYFPCWSLLNKVLWSTGSLAYLPRAD